MFGSTVGRYTSPDPTLLSINAFNAQSWNRYVYVLNNPYKYTDPLGLWELRLVTIHKTDKDGNDILKDGKLVIDRIEVLAVKTSKDDTAASLAKQLGLTGRDAERFASKIGSGDRVRLSEQGGIVGNVFNSVESGLSQQVRFAEKNPGKAADGRGPIGDDCSETACRIAYPMQMFKSLTFSVQQADGKIQENNSKSINESELRIADIVRWAKDGAPTHFASFIFRNDNGDPVVYSKSGAKGPFEIATTSDPRWARYGYGTISGIRKDDTGYYRP